MLPVQLLGDRWEPWLLGKEDGLGWQSLRSPLSAPVCRERALVRTACSGTRRWLSLAHKLTEVRRILAGRWPPGGTDNGVGAAHRRLAACRRDPYLPGRRQLSDGARKRRTDPTGVTGRTSVPEKCPCFPAFRRYPRCAHGKLRRQQVDSCHATKRRQVLSEIVCLGLLPGGRSLPSSAFARQQDPLSPKTWSIPAQLVLEGRFATRHSKFVPKESERRPQLPHRRWAASEQVGQQPHNRPQEF